MKKQYNPLPKLLRHFREKKNYTQAQVASMLSMSRSGYANYESGRILPRIEHIIQLSKILDHDFLFAYSLSLQDMYADSYDQAQEVYELSAYQIDADNKNKIRRLLQMLHALPENELDLLEIYLHLLTAESETTKQNQEDTTP